MGNLINKKSLTGIFVFCFCANANNMTLGLIAYVMQTYSDVSTTTVALIMTVPSLVGMIYAFFVGTINQKVSAKTLLMFGQTALVIEGMIFLFLGGKAPIYVMLVAAGCAGFGQGSNNTLLGMLLLDAVPDDKKRNSILGICMATMNLGGVFFTTVGGFLADGGNWQKAYYLYFIIAAAVVLEFIFIANLKPVGAQTPAGGEKAVGKLPIKVWLISIHYLFYFMFMYVYGLNVSEYIITTYKLGTSVQSGIAASMVTVGGVVAGVVFGAYSKILKRFSVPVSILLVTIGLLLPLTLTTNIIGIYIAGFCAGFSMSSSMPYVMSYLAEIVPPQLYSKAMSIYSGFMNVGMFIAIYVIAFLTKVVCGDGTDVHYKFLVGTVGAAICLVTSIPIYLGKTKKEAEE